MDIFVVQETWLSCDSEIDIQGFNSYHFNRPDVNSKAWRPSGGISIFIRENICKKVTVQKNYCDNIVWLKIDCNDGNKPLMIGAVYLYHEHSTGNVSRDDFFQLLSNDLQSFGEDYRVCLIGDFNARTGNMSDIPLEVEGSDVENNFVPVNVAFPAVFCSQRKSIDKVHNNYGSQLLDLCKSAEMRVANGRFKDSDKFTFYGSNGASVIDYAIVNNVCAESIVDFKISKKLPESDHVPIYIDFMGKIPTDKFYTPGQPLFKYVWKDNLHLLKDSIKNEQCLNLRSRLFDSITMGDDINIISDLWSEYFYAAVDNVFEKKLCKKHIMKSAPWIDDECINMRKLIMEGDCSVSERNYKALLQNKKRSHKNKVLNDLNNSCVKNPVDFWKTLNSLNNCNKNVTMPPIEVCEKLQKLSSIPHQEYFDTEFDKEIMDFIDLYARDGSSCCNKELNSILNANVEIDEIVYAVHKIKSGKSAGIDLLPIEFIKETIHVIKYDLQLLYNYILKSEIYPDSWCHGLRIAIPKGANDIRPITIEPIFAKIFETILDNRISFANESLNLNDRYNGGFMKGAQTQDNVLILTACIHKQLAQNNKLFVAFVDFTKAFNYVAHHVLFYKLLCSGMAGNFVNLLRNMYTKIQAYIKVNNKVYDIIKDLCGTNQGGPISPNMFRYMLHDLRNFLHSYCGIVLDDEVLLHLLWADDLVLVANSPEGLQKQLDGLFTFCSKFKMIVNELKSKVMIFGNCKDIPNFIFNGKRLDIVDNYKYLGVVINSIKNMRGNLFKDMISYCCDKARKCTFSISKKFTRIGTPSTKTLLQLFESYTMPVLNYASEIWCHYKELPDIERVQLRFLKHTLGVKDSTCSLAIYGETGCFPIYIQHICKIIKYWCRIVKLDNSVLVKKAYNCLKELDTFGFKTWAHKVKSILINYDLLQYWNCENLVIANKRFYEDFKKKVKDLYISSWSTDIFNYPQLRTFVNFKNTFEMSHYLLGVKNFKIRKQIAKFRLSSHSLEIEKGRHHKPKIPADDRICSVCDSGLVGDEKHLFLYCNLFHDTRVKFLCKVFAHSDNFCDIVYDDLFNVIMSSEDYYICFITGKFLAECFNLRCR